MNHHEHKCERRRHEEVIEIIGLHLEQGEVRIPDLQEHDITLPRLLELVESNHLLIEDEKVQFRKKGQREFLNIIRRHRLAERLLHDVLDYFDEEGSMEMVGKMEHILNEDVTDSICTLLGHPSNCPHGLPIPRGRCCELKQDQVPSLITPLNRMTPGEEGVIAFISTTDHDKSDRLAAMGILPGVVIKLHQLKPAVVVMFDETILSMDEDYAQAVYVRRK